MTTGELKRVQRAARKAALAAEERDRAIVAAHAAGASLRAIGQAAGISHVRVLQIVRAHGLHAH